MLYNQMFQEDLFSEHRTKYVPAGKEMAALIDSLVKTYYAHKIGCVVSVEQSGALEINSNNFKVSTITDTYLIKRHLGQRDLHIIERNLDIAQYLSENSVAVPKMISTDDGMLYCLYADVYWTVSLFIMGNYFSGLTKKEIILTAQAIGKLFETLSSLPKDIQPLEQIHYNLQEWDSLIAECCQRKNEWISMFGLEIAEALEQNWEVIEMSLWTLKKKNINTELHAPCHIDLHPHNLLVGENSQVTIIDLDSIKLANPRTMLAFGVYKLMRQYASHAIKETTIQEIREKTYDFYQEIEKIAHVIEEDENLLQYYAMMEVFRRICIIIEQNLQNGCSDWNHVLMIQINALSEISVMF